MEEKLRKLLTDLIQEETTRKNTVMETNLSIEQEKERLNFKEQNEIERFVDGMKQDIESGWYNNRKETEIQRIINETQNSIKERYNREREQLTQKLEDIQKQNEDSKSNSYKQMNTGIKEYHIDMVLEANNAKRELASLEEKRKEVLDEVNKKISEKEAKRTHLIIRNRMFMDIEETQISADIRLLEVELEQLKEEKQLLSNEYDTKIETQSQYVKYCTEQKEKAAKLLGQIISSKSLEEIYQELFGKQEVFEEEEQQQESEVVEEEQQQEPEVVEEEKQQEPEVVEEEKQQEPEVVEEEKQQEPEVIEEEKQQVQEVEKIAISEDERNYQYFERNKKSIQKYFMYVTGIKETEIAKIFEDKNHCKNIGEICRKAMVKVDRDALRNKVQNYYLGIESRLDIEVSSKGIRYNDEEIEPLDVISFGDNDDEKQFLDRIIKIYDNTISTIPDDHGNIVYDKNIISAIAMDNCTVDANNKLKLTMSGNKKLNQYLRLIVNSKQQKGSVTYNLEKVSIIRGILNGSAWTPKKVMEIKKVANKARKTYATIIPDKMTQYFWNIQDWIKGIKTKKLASGEQELQTEQETQNSNNSWQLQEEQKEYANSRTNNEEAVSKSTEVKEEDVQIL